MKPIEELEKQLKELFDFEYDFTDYNGARSCIKVFCKKHGWFSKKVTYLMSGYGCIECDKLENIQKASVKYFQKVTELYEGSFDFSLSEYKGSKVKIEIVCSNCGEHYFVDTNNLISRKFRCIICDAYHHYTTEEFVKKAELVHGNKYDYSTTEYKSGSENVEVFCKEHGSFPIKPIEHLRGHGCQKCGMLDVSLKQRKPLKQFIEEALKIHKEDYDYSNFNYVNNYSKGEIICKACGTHFLQSPSHHLKGQGCSCRKQSFGERFIANYLKENNIEFVEQYAAAGCVFKDQLKFDFFLPKKNIAIEFNGRQHYQAVEYFGGEKEFMKQLERDQAKRNFCLKENIFLLEIKYDQNIENILKEIV
jgi:transposase-like protein